MTPSVRIDARHKPNVITLTFPKYVEKHVFLATIISDGTESKGYCRRRCRTVTRVAYVIDEYRKIGLDVPSEISETFSARDSERQTSTPAVTAV